MSVQQPILIGEAFKEGWKLTKEHLGFLIGYQIILYFLAILFSGAHRGFAWSAWHILGWIVVILAKMGLYNSILLISVGIKPTFSQLYANWHLFFSWVVASFLFAVLFIIGLILLIVPGFYVWARYGLFPFFILDKGIGPIEALKETAKATEGMRWEIFCLLLACAGLNLLGFLCFGVGLLFTVPITLFALTRAYRQISPKLG